MHSKGAEDWQGKKSLKLPGDTEVDDEAKSTDQTTSKPTDALESPGF